MAYRVHVIAAEFNSLVTKPLAEGAAAVLQNSGHEVTTLWVPGALELPITARRLYASGNPPDGIVAVGCVIRGETWHFEAVAGESAKGIHSVALQYGRPVMNAILTVDTLEQALNRSGLKLGNKGAEAASGLIALLDTYAAAGI